jgi:hypothetical protein
MIAFVALFALFALATAQNPIVISNSTAFKNQANEANKIFKSIVPKNRKFIPADIKTSFAAAVNFKTYTNIEPAVAIENIDTAGNKMAVNNITLFAPVLDELEKLKAIGEYVIANAEDPDNTLEVPDYFTADNTTTTTTTTEAPLPTSEPTTTEPSTTEPAASAAKSNVAGIFVALAAIAVMLF